jgi:hypothetical protein
LVSVSRARRFAAVGGAVLALLGSSAALAGTKTTEPGKNIAVYFVFTDQKLTIGIYRQGPDPSFLFIDKYVVRGDFATFNVINRGKKQHSIAFMGKKFRLKPGQKAHFSRALLVRGAFPYSSSTDRGKTFNGVFRVY